MEVKIDGKYVDFFTNISITLKLDSIASTFEFSCRFSADNKDHQEILKPLQYKDVEIYNKKRKKIFSGTILNHVFKSNKGRELVVISGYSKSGILEDVTIPVSSYPLETNGLSLFEISEKLCGLYGIKVLVSDQAKTIVNTKLKDKTKQLTEKTTYDAIKAKANAPFGKTSASPTESVKDYLAKLAGQKNIILSHNENGDVLLFQPSYNQKPKYFFNKEDALEMQSSFNGQALHSEINLVCQPSDENEGVSTADKAVNTLVGKYRPTTKILSSGEETDTKEAAKNELANELKAIQVNVKLQGLYDEIYPGEIINVHNHYIYSYAYNRFMVDSITLSENEKEEITELNLVVPESFTGGELIRNILFNHHDHDYHREPHLNE
jgi:prophage tail gpP-like protein